MTAPLLFRWDGEAMVPANPYWSRRADQEYVVGEAYQLEPLSETSPKSMAHEFAFLRECWQNLSEDLADQFPTAEHLRKRLLIERGFYTEQLIDAGTNAAALRVAAFARGEDEFAHVVVRGPIVVVRKARSQSRRAMKPDEFQASKTAILEAAADLIGVSPGELQKNTGKAA